MKKKTIAVHIQTEVQFFAIEPVLEALRKYPYQVTILIEKHDGNTEGHKEKSMGTVQLMKDHGYSPKYSEDFLDTEFDLCLTPYIDGMVKANCFLKYDYGSMNTKPILTYIPSLLKGFHGFLCLGTDGLNILSTYGRTFPVDNLRFLGKTRKTNKGKKKIALYAPTYNDEYDASEDAEIINELKKKYYVIAKSHHGIKYLKKNRAQNQKLMEGADEYHGSETNLIDLMMRADVCLANCSSVIGDAMRAGVPCAVYTHDIDAFRWMDFHSTQYDLYKAGDLLVCSKPEQVPKMMDKALSNEYKKNWNKLAERFYPKEFRTGVKGYLDVINYYLNDSEAQKAILLHNYYILEQNNELLRRDMEIEQLKRENSAQREEIKIFRNGKLYKIATKTYGVYGALRNKIRKKDE